MDAVGIEGVMNIVESPTGISDFKLVHGLIFNRGLVNTNFVQELAGGNLIEQSIEFDHPLILVVADKIDHIQNLLPILELVKKSKKPLVIFSMDLQEEPASTLVYNNIKGIVSCAAVNIPWAGGVELEQLKDIAVMTGATIVDNEHMLTLPQVRMEHFGTAKFTKINEYETSIVGGSGQSDAIEERI